MNLPTETFGNVVVVHAPEELAADQVDGFRAFLGKVDHPSVVLDLDRTETLDSAGLTALLDCQDELRSQSGDLKIATSNVYNRKILEVTRLDAQLEIFGSVIEAVKSYRP
jgi:anti-sigma B factor antagonist